ncbi:MAG: hypothetical protein Q9216_004988 [Gyalolechia sp. 2 TL-2023]
MRPPVRSSRLQDVCIFCSARIQLASAAPTSRTQRRFLRSSNASFKPPATAAAAQAEALPGPIYGDAPKSTPSFGGGWGKSSFSVELTPAEAALRKNTKQSRGLDPKPVSKPRSSNYSPRPPLQPGLKSSAQPALKTHPSAADVSTRSRSHEWKCQECKATNNRARSQCLKCNRLDAGSESAQWRCTNCGWHNPHSGTGCARCASFSAYDAQIDELAKQWTHVRRYERNQHPRSEPEPKSEVGELDPPVSREQRDRELGAEEGRRQRLERTRGGRFVGFRAATFEDAQSKIVRSQRQRQDPLMRDVSQASHKPAKKDEPQRRIINSRQHKEQDRKAEASNSPSYSQHFQNDAELHASHLQRSQDSSSNFGSGWGTYKSASGTLNSEEKNQRPAPSGISDLPRTTPNSQPRFNSIADPIGPDASSTSPIEATSNFPSHRSLNWNAPWQDTSRSRTTPKTATYSPDENNQEHKFSPASEANTGNANYEPFRFQSEDVGVNQRNKKSHGVSQPVRQSFTGTDSKTKPDISDLNDRRTSSRFDRRDDDTARYANYASNAAAPYAYNRRSRKPRYAQDDYDDEDLEYDEDRQDARQRRKEQRKKEKAAQRRAHPPTPIYLPEFISVGNLARALRVRVEDFARKMQDLGFEETNNDHLLDAEVAGLIAAEFNFEPIVDRSSEDRDIQARPPAEDRLLLDPRPPIVTIMGHVDHGKTTLLDYLRKSSVAASEHGGITQHIGAFSVSMPGGRLVTFLDTPGHAAFLSMRQRGANVTDIVILVVAADDSVKPQTIEAIKHAQAAKVPMIVAINKVDKEDKNIDRVKQDLARYGVEIEDFGGDTQVVCVSGKTGQGLNELEENVVALADILDMRAETDGQAEGWVLEGATKRAGRVATVLVRRGTIRRGDIIVAGTTWAKIKTLKNEAGAQVPHAGPGTPVEVDGWKDQPTAGDEVLQATSEQQAKSAIDYRLAQAEKEHMAADMSAVNESRRLEQERKEATANAPPTSPATSTETSATTGTQDPQTSASRTGEVQPVATPSTAGPTTLPIVLKADVSGSVEACLNSITGLGTSIISPLILRSSVGPISESDITFAASSGAQIVSFNQTCTPEIYKLAEREGVKVVEENVIYRLTDLVKRRLEDLLPEKVESKVVGEAEIAKPFEIGIGGRKKMLVAGCRVRNGIVSRVNKVKVLRGGEGGECVFDGTLSSLKSVKKDVTEMRKGMLRGEEGEADIMMDVLAVGGRLSRDGEALHSEGGAVWPLKEAGVSIPFQLLWLVKVKDISALDFNYSSAHRATKKSQCKH